MGEKTWLPGVEIWVLIMNLIAFGVFVESEWFISCGGTRSLSKSKDTIERTG